MSAPAVLTNVRSERVRALHGLSRRVARERAGRFLAEGPQAVREALAAHTRRTSERGVALVHELLVASEALRGPVAADLVATAQAQGVRVTEASADVLAALSDTVHPQGIVAVCALVDRPLADVCRVIDSPGLVAVLSRVRDPGNAGTVLRAADAAGADAVVLTDESVDVHNPKCVRASAGSLFHLPVATGVPLADVLSALRGEGLTILAADSGPGAEDLDVLLDEAERRQGPLVRPTAWVFGNEAWGLTDADLALVDHVVRVPIHGAAESLNLATAAAVCLYASARIRRAA